MSERLRHRLEIQAAGIEEVLQRHALSAQVTGGRLQQDATRFIVEGAGPADLVALRELQEDLADSLNAPEVQIQRANGGFYVDVYGAEAPPVSLLELLDQVPVLPPAVAVLGWSADERPVLLNLSAEETTHVLIMGEHGAGKTALLRTCAISLALNNRQSQVQMLFVDPELAGQEAERGLHAMQYLPHVLTGVVTQLEDVAEVLAFLREEMVHRTQQRVRRPRIVVFVDQLTSLLEEGGNAVRKPLQALLGKGARAGIHLVLSTDRPQAAVLEPVLAAGVLLRLVGKVANQAAAQAATGISDAGAEHLMGRGDFLAWDGQSTVRFQAAYLDEYDLHLCLEQLHRRRAPALLAQPAAVRAQLRQKEGAPAEQADFVFDGERVILPTPDVKVGLNGTREE